MSNVRIGCSLKWQHENTDQILSRKIYYLHYTALFLITSFFCFFWFIKSDTSFIAYGDGWSQHFRALVYYSQYLKDMIRQIISEHRVVIKDWDFYIGEGTDVVNAFHYYVIGDPITVLSVLVPIRYMQYFYSVSVVLRMFLAGVAFSELCLDTGIESSTGILAGALSYAFCFWALFNVARHPYFLNPLIYCPLLILGVEKIIRKRKPGLFMWMTAISAASNFYFFYMLVLTVGTYVIVRVVLCYKNDIQKGIQLIGRTLLSAIIGVSISGVLFVPVLMTFLTDSRLSVSQPFHWLYPLGYYSRIPSIMISNNWEYWLIGGFTAPAIISVFYLFSQKKYMFLKILMVICLLILLIPIGGRILNGMSYMSNRWSWAMALLCSYTLAVTWEEIHAVSNITWRMLLICSLVYYALCLLFDKSRTAATFSVIPFLLIVLITLKYDATCRINQLVITNQTISLLIIFINVIVLAFWKYSPDGEDTVSTCIKNNDIWNQWYNNEAYAIKGISSEVYPRMTGNVLTSNANISAGVSSTQYYWSMSNPSINQYRTDLSMKEASFFNYYGYDNRTVPLALASVNYYSMNNGSSNTPFGYSFLDTVSTDTTWRNKLEELKIELGTETLSEAQTRRIVEPLWKEYRIYKNDYALPLGYCYDKYISEEEWKKMNPIQRQQILLEGVLVEENLNGQIYNNLIHLEEDTDNYLVPFSTESIGTDVFIGDHKIITTADNKSISLSLKDSTSFSELYVGFENLNFEATPEYDLYFGGNNIDPYDLYGRTMWSILPEKQKAAISKEKKYWNPVVDTSIVIETDTGKKNTILYYPPDAGFSSGRHDFIANMGYGDESIDSIIITFSKKGTYTFDDINIYSVSMTDYPQKIENIRKDSLQDISFGIDIVEGNLCLDRVKVLCMAIPYSDGWEVFIDGAKSEVLLLNEHYIGTLVPKGNHKIMFHYSRPYREAGAVMSILGLSYAVINALRQHYVKTKVQTA